MNIIFFLRFPHLLILFLCYSTEWAGEWVREYSTSCRLCIYTFFPHTIPLDDFFLFLHLLLLFYLRKNKGKRYNHLTCINSKRPQQTTAPTVRWIYVYEAMMMRESSVYIYFLCLHTDLREAAEKKLLLLYSFQFNEKKKNWPKRRWRKKIKYIHILRSLFRRYIACVPAKLTKTRAKKKKQQFCFAEKSSWSDYFFYSYSSGRMKMCHIRLFLSTFSSFCHRSSHDILKTHTTKIVWKEV